MMWEKPIYQAAAGVLFLTFVLSAAGCSDRPPSVAIQETPAVSTPSMAASNVPSTANTNVPPTALTATMNQDKQAASVNAVQQAAVSDTKGPAGSTSQARKTFDPYTAEKPLLMGVAIGDTKDNATQLHGSPSDSYVTEDGDDPITVAQYKGFYIGYNSKKLVEFVEVADSDLDPGLNGLRLGQTTSDTLTALGKPDASTDYVLTYRTKQTILKLDVDPKTKTVQSIKLFRRIE